MHRPVLLQESLAALSLTPDGTYVDGTFGRGGHSRAILERLGPRGRLIALDRDPEAERAAREIRDSRFSFFRMPFSRLSEAITSPVHGMLFDLGVSSPQLDAPQRGFSFRADGPLDMRMDPDTGPSAADFLATAQQEQITEVLRDYGEERFAKQIAAAVVAARRGEPILRTRQLADLVAKTVRTREPGQDPATRTFQALRIHVNRELEEVSLMLPAALAGLAPGGRLAVIAFHSLEDRIVKQFFRAQARQGLANEVPRRLPLRASEMPQPVLKIVGKPTKPAAEEVKNNPRARSATLRVAERTAAPFNPQNTRIEPGARWRN